MFRVRRLRVGPWVHIGTDVTGPERVSAMCNGVFDLTEGVWLPIAATEGLDDDGSMHLERVAERTEDLAATVGPFETLLAMARLEDALASLEHVAGQDVIDLREAREVLARTEPVVARAEVRIEDLTRAMAGD